MTRSGKYYFTLYLFILIIVSVNHISGISQETPSNMHFDHLTINDGLSHNSIYCMLQDHYGYVWIGTQNGLNKYDGYTFEVHRSNGLEENKSGFIGKNISALFEDSKDNLWVGTAKYGINIRSKYSDRFKNLLLDTCFNAIKGSQISAIYEDKDNNIWITTIGAGVLKYEPETGTSQHYNEANSGLSNNLVFDVVQDKNGIIWVATAGVGLNCMKDSTFTFSHDLLPFNPNMSGFRKKLYLDDDFLWLATEGTGLYKIDLSDNEVTHFSPESSPAINSNVVRDICRIKGDKLYIATDGAGLNVYDLLSNQVHSYNPQNNDKQSINSSALLSLLEDRSGNIWIGTYNGGINIYKPTKTWFDLIFPSYGQASRIKSHSILSLAHGKDGTIYFGTDGGGFNILDKKNDQNLITNFQSEKSKQNTLTGNAVKTIFQDRKEQIWLGVYGKNLNVYNTKSNTFRELDGIRSVWSIAENAKDQMAFGTMGEGLIIYNQESKQSIRFQHDDDDSTTIASNLIMNVMYDNKGDLWIGTSDFGLDIWSDSTQSFIHFAHNPKDSSSLSNDEVRAIIQDSKGEIWIGTEGGGVNHWLGHGQFERITEDQGLIANSIMGITEDINGHIWITTFKGISRYDPLTKAIENFDFRTAQNANQFNQMAILSAADDRLYFGGTNGLHSIRPEEVRLPNTQAPVLFTGLEVSNRKIEVGYKENGHIILDGPIESATKIDMSYLDNSFSLSFSAIDYTSLNDNVYEYKMDGFEDMWHITKPNQNSVSYTNLDPGDYVFRVKYRDNEASIKILIHPPFHQSLLFKVLLILFITGALVGGFFFLMRRRDANYKRQLLQLEKEKLETSVEAKNSKLMFFAVQMAHKNEILTNIKTELKSMFDLSDNKVGKIVNRLDRELKNDNYWDDFNVYFNRVDQHFVKSIQKEYPDLTSNDIRLCSLIRMNLSNKEIASLCNISDRGVEQSKYRLKKRLTLPKDEDLSRFISLYKSEK